MTPLLKPQQVALLLGVSAPTVRTLCASGALECCRVGAKGIRVSEAQLAA
jgi:excisionase family DNA binding protein